MKKSLYIDSIFLLILLMVVGCGGGEEGSAVNDNNEQVVKHYQDNSFKLLPLNANIADFKVAKTNPSKLVCVTHDQPFKFYISNDDGLNWAEIKNSLFSGEYPHISISDTDENLVFITSSDSIYKSTDGGYNWQKPPQISGLDKWRRVSINKNIVVASRQNSLGVKTMFKSLDYGETWINITPYNMSFPFAMMVDPFDENTIYAQGDLLEKVEHVNDNTIIYTKNELYVSNDGGQNFYGSNLTPVQINSIFINPQNGDVFATSSGDLYLSKDKGSNWQTITSLPFTIDDVIIIDETVILSGGQQTLKISYDNMNTWEDINIYKSGNSQKVGARILGFSDKYIYFSSYFGIYRSSRL